MSFVAVLLYGVVGLLSWLVFQWLHTTASKPHHRIYVRPGFWYPVKYAFFRLVLWLRKQRNERQQSRKQATSDNAGYGVKSRNSPEEMDRIQVLPPHEPKAVDAVYINGGSEDGTFMVAATARRQNDVVQTILYIRLPHVGLLELPSLPDTWLQDKNSQKAFTAGGLTLAPVLPMKTWSMDFDGTLRIAESGKKVKVTFSLLWKAYTKCFDFDTDLHPHVMADAISRERWSREYFDTLKRSHQTHYEQFGEISGTVHVEGYSDQSIKLQGVRDHSYGNVRDWKDLHRYAMNYAHLQDGTALCVGAISMPSSLSRLVVGYVFKPDGTMDAVSSSDFEFYEWGDDGNPPQSLQLTFMAGGKQYNLKCEVIQCPVFFMGQDWDAKIYERFSSYTVNGVKGWGISEWDYRNYAGKEAELKRLSETDANARDL